MSDDQCDSHAPSPNRALASINLARPARPPYQDLQPYGRQGLTALDYALENSYPDVIKVPSRQSELSTRCWPQRWVSAGWCHCVVGGRWGVLVLAAAQRFDDSAKQLHTHPRGGWRRRPPPSPPRVSCPSRARFRLHTGALDEQAMARRDARWGSWKTGPWQGQGQIFCVLRGGTRRSDGRSAIRVAVCSATRPLGRLRARGTRTRVELANHRIATQIKL